MGAEQREVAGHQPPRVFVTYSHDSPEHKDLVLRFCTFLRVQAGVDVHVDRWYEDVRRDWSVWAIEQLTVAHFILVIASPEYKRKLDAGEDRRTQFEGAIIRDNLVRDLPAETRRVLPVVLPGRSAGEIPAFLHAYSTTHYAVTDFTLAGVRDLLLVLSGVAEHQMPERGRFTIPATGLARRRARNSSAGSHTLDQLATAVRDQWRAEERFRRLQDPVPIQTCWGPPAQPGIEDHRSNIGLEGDRPELSGRLDQIADVFAIVPSRRLVVLGEPGAGKTVLALRLALDLLDRRESGGPVPVLLTLGSWNPNRESLHDWMAARLLADYPGLGTPAAAGDLITEGRVIPILDGLDEIPSPLRVSAIRRVNAALHPGDPLVVTCRSGEYVSAVAEADVITAAAVVELRPLKLDDLADYLPRTARRTGKWEKVIAYLRQHSNDHRARDVLSVLTVPLMTSLARAAYSDTSADPAELLCDKRFTSPDAIADHLVDQLLPVAYDEMIRGRGWTVGQARTWLAFLAGHIAVVGEYSFAWWRLYEAVPRFLAACVGAAVCGATAGVPVAFLAGWQIGLTVLVVGAAAGGLVNLTPLPMPSTVRLRPRGGMAKFRLRVPPRSTPVGWLVATAILAVALYLSSGPAGVILAGVSIVLAFALDTWFDVPAEVSRAADPGSVLRADRIAALSKGIARGGVIGIAAGVIAGPVVGAGFGLGTVLVSVSFTSWGRFAVARSWLALCGRLPWRLMSFLDDARRRGVLRQAGGMYQFRHAMLQDRLCDKEIV